MRRSLRDQIRDLLNLVRESLNSPGFWLGWLMTAYLLWNSRHSLT
ncbi:hypothetical protein OG896_24805 [Streptomyces sp. NBC_00669]|nr:hypothetical protein [Streptomyces sp. NBC_00669]